MRGAALLLVAAGLVLGACARKGDPVSPSDRPLQRQPAVTAPSEVWGPIRDKDDD